MILGGQIIRNLNIFEPFVERTVHEQTGMSYGLSYAGYDIRVRENLELGPRGFSLASSIEHFRLPKDALGIVHDKSSLARAGLSVFNTVLEPGWEGFLTLELVNQSDRHLTIYAGQPIAQVVLHGVIGTEGSYTGKYQHQPPEPVSAIREPHLRLVA